MLPTNGFPDDTSTTSSSSDRTSSSVVTVSNVTETLSSVALALSSREPKAVPNLPPEIILHIYENLHNPCDIAALNRTSWTNYWIWKINAASISEAVLSRSIDCYNSALELFEVEERVKQIHCIILPQSAVLKRVSVAQKQARDIVRQGRCKDPCNHISRGMLFGGVIYRNEELLSAAKNASYLLRLIEKRVVYSGGEPLQDFYHRNAPRSHDIIVAYHEFVILMRLRLFEAMKARLKTMYRKKIRNLQYVATYLLCDCPDKDKILLGISRRNNALRPATSNWATDDLDEAFRPGCHVNLLARRAFFALAYVAEDTNVLHNVLNLLDDRAECHGDCEGFDEAEAN